MYTLTNFHYASKTQVCSSHVMMFVVELNTYVNIWNIENTEVVVKMNIPETTKRKRITNKKVIKNLVDLANKMINDNKQQIEKLGFVNL